MKLLEWSGDYYDCPYFNASLIKQGNKSIKHMFYAAFNHKTPTAAMERGTLQHMAILEPHKLLDNYFVADIDLRTKTGKEILAANKGKKPIKPAEKADLNECYKAVHNHPFIADFDLFNGLEAEKAIYWQEDNGIQCKAKLDGLSEAGIIEYKTTSSLDTFLNSAYRMSYHLQLAWYQRAVFALTGYNKPAYIIAQETSAPFDVAVFKVEIFEMRPWLDKCFDIIQRFKQSEAGRMERLGAYPELIAFTLPAWADEKPAEMEESEVIF